MIGKLKLGSGAAALIKYCYYAKDENGRLTDIIRGELLYSNQLYESRLSNGHLDINNIASQYQRIADTNSKTTKFIWHQTLNFHPEEKVSNEMMVTLAREFAQAFGFKDNQYLVFRHRDRTNDHFHIVANRIDAMGKNTASDQKNYEKIQQWCRVMENKYKLRLTENHLQKLDARHNRDNQQAEKLKKILDAVVPGCQTMSELGIALRRKNITMYLGRGVSFTNKRSGVSFKGSDLGREYSRAGIEKRLGIPSPGQKTGVRFDGLKRQALRDSIDSIVKNVSIILSANAASQEAVWKAFGVRLKDENITLRLARNPTSGKITGVTFQTQGSRFVAGQELGEQYSHTMLAMRFGRSSVEFAQLMEQKTTQDSKEDATQEKDQQRNATEVPTETNTRMVTGPNGTYETNKDLAKIAQSLRTVAQKKNRPKI